MIYRCITLASLVFSVGNLSAQALTVMDAPSGERVASRIHQLYSRKGLSGEHSWRVTHQHMDENVPVHHLQHYYHGIKIWGAQTNVREERDEAHVVANTVSDAISIHVEPVLAETEVLSLVDRELRREMPRRRPMKGTRSVSAFDEGNKPNAGDGEGITPLNYLSQPSTELVIFPMEAMQVRPEAAHKPMDKLNAEDVTYVVTEYRLAYHVATDAEVAGRREMMNYLVDAHSGEVLQTWNMVKRAAVAGTANTKYSGTVTLYTHQNGSAYETRDPLYYNNFVSNSINSSMPYTDADNVWGNGGNYFDGTDLDRQTGAAEALYGLQRTCQMLKAVWGRNGSSGTGTTMKVIWGAIGAKDTACYVTEDCIVSGYEDELFYDMNKLDVIGHEYGHSLDYYTAGLCVNAIGETGGIGEAHADIMGLLTEVYGKYTPNDPDQAATTIPEAGLSDPKTWICTEDAAKITLNEGKGLRFFIKPSWDKEEGVIDAWTPDMLTMEIHTATGPTDRMFYYLAVGAPSNTSHDGYTSFLPNGSAGIGLHKAANIWVKTMLSGRLNSSSKHMDARNACIATATSLYGFGGPEEQAVWNAYAGVNVGQPWPNIVETVPSIEAQPVDATVRMGEKATFTVSATGGLLNYTWYKNGAIISGATAATYTTLAANNADNGATYAVVVSNRKGSVTSHNATLTVLPLPGTEKLANGGFERGSVSWLASPGVIGTFIQHPAYEGRKNAVLCGNGRVTNEYLYQTVTIPSTATQATLSFYLHIDTEETTNASENDKLLVHVRNSSGTVLETLGSYSNLTTNDDYRLNTFDLSPFIGQTIQIYFNASEDSALQTAFVLDRVSLMIQ